MPQRGSSMNRSHLSSDQVAAAPVADKLAATVCSERTERTEDGNRFEEIGLPLTVVSEDEIGGSMPGQGAIGEIPESLDPESRQLHSDSHRHEDVDVLLQPLVVVHGNDHALCVRVSELDLDQIALEDLENLDQIGRVE